jgi:RES domain-containing protein
VSTRNRITAWRLIKARLANHAFSGEGARLYGGRWNSPGIAVVYASATASLAVLEVFANVQRSELLGAYMLLSCAFDESLVERVAPNELPGNWRRSPGPPELQSIGDAWARNQRSAILEVPSAIIEREKNYLLNPRHPDFDRVIRSAAEPFRFSPRLLG